MRISDTRPKSTMVNSPRKSTNEPVQLTLPDLTGFDFSEFSAFLRRVDPEWLAMNGRLPPSSDGTQEVQGGFDFGKENGSVPSD